MNRKSLWTRCLPRMRKKKSKDKVEDTRALSVRSSCVCPVNHEKSATPAFLPASPHYITLRGLHFYVCGYCQYHYNTVGLLLRKGLPESVSDAMMKGLGLCTIFIGIQGMIEEEYILVLILSTIVGIVIGELLDVDGRINRAAERLTSRFSGKGEGAKIAQAFVTSCLIMNVGAMTIVGSLDAGLRGNFGMLYTKSLLDLISGIPMAAAMGVGVMGSALFTLVFQGGIVLLAEYIAPYLSETLIKELVSTGSLMILAIGFNMLGVTKLKVLNYLPGLLVVPLALKLMQTLGF